MSYATISSFDNSWTVEQLNRYNIYKCYLDYLIVTLYVLPYFACFKSNEQDTQAYNSDTDDNNDPTEEENANKRGKGKCYLFCTNYETLEEAQEMISLEGCWW